MDTIQLYDVAIYSSVVILFIVVAILTFNRTMVEYKKWANWVDCNFPFMSDQEVRDYVDKHLVSAMTNKCTCTDCNCKNKE